MLGDTNKTRLNLIERLQKYTTSLLSVSIIMEKGVCCEESQKDSISFLIFHLPDIALSLQQYPQTSNCYKN